jgi:demethylmenaquinone methyltransferase/2-methoxy-6-polyprenyl-1,4-benzoquinol methylase
MEIDCFHVIINALEETIPYYQKVNEWISLREANKARQYLVQNSKMLSSMLVADVGVGPGSMSQIILSKYKLNSIVILDVSKKMLEAAKENLAGFKAEILAVRCAFEHLPFKNNIFDRIFVSFALQDSMLKKLAIKEFHRTCKKDGFLLIANIGKPDNAIIQFLMAFYMRFLMPTIAKILTFKKISKNPWKSLIAVFKKLPSNSSLMKMIEEVFGEAYLKKFLLGGIISIIARKRM